MLIGGHRGLGCTDHDFYQDIRPIADLPVENTSESVAAAFQAGADYVEIDAVMSSDGVVFTLHNVVPKDHFFGKVVPRKLLNDLPFSEIERYYTGRGQNGTVSALEHVLRVIEAHDPKTAPFVVNIEIKGVQGSGQPYEVNDYLQRLAATIAETGFPVERVLFSSFALRNITAMSHLLPNAQYGMLFSEREFARSIYADHVDDISYQYLPFDQAHIGHVLNHWAMDASDKAKLSYFHPEVQSITSELIAEAAKISFGINCWALFEKLTEKRKARYQAIADECAAEKVFFSAITDFIADMK